MENIQPIFIVSSGRSGTAMMHKILSQDKFIECHHEYLCNHVQQVACLWEMKYLKKSVALEQIEKIYSPALRYSQMPIFIDSSNKTSWIIDLLFELYPNSKFIHLIRDGRKVVSSFYHKLRNECYDDRSVYILQNAIENNEILPPPEKKYYWPIPFFSISKWQIFKELDQFGRICWYWGEVNSRIEDNLRNLPKNQYIQIKLEELVSSRKIVKHLFNFIEAEYREDYFIQLQIPHNVNRPSDILLSQKERMTLDLLAGEFMSKYGYDQTREYKMQYLNND